MDKTIRLNKVFDAGSIIRKCLNGDVKAQRAMYDYLAPMVYPVCIRYAGNTFDADDILQEGFVKLFSSLAQYQFKGAFEGWARRIFVNSALERYRSRFYMYTTSEPAPEVLGHSSDEPAVEDTLSAGEILECIANLSPQYRMVFNLYAIEGYSHKEIADLLTISEGTSKSNLARARGILQQRIEQLAAPEKQVV